MLLRSARFMSGAEICWQPLSCVACSLALPEGAAPAELGESDSQRPNRVTRTPGTNRGFVLPGFRIGVTRDRSNGGLERFQADWNQNELANRV
jgi:hypothetical protein